MSIASLIEPNPENAFRSIRATTAGDVKGEDIEGVASAVLDAAHALSAASVSDWSTSNAPEKTTGVQRTLIHPADNREHPRERSRKRQDYATTTVSAQAGRLLQRVRLIVRQILELCLSDAGVTVSPHMAPASVSSCPTSPEAADTYPGLERVLVDLFNAILSSHTDLAAREVSSQKQPLAARPPFISSLDQLRVLLYGHADQTGNESFEHTPKTDRPGMASPLDREIYVSTLEFLVLMTAFVSVVCWLMDTLVQCSLQQVGWTLEEGMPSSGQATDLPPNIPQNLVSFLALFSNRDNFMRIIQKALARDDSTIREAVSHDTATDYTGLLTWHFYLFASQGLEQTGREMVDESLIGQIQFDVVMNDLYSTHVLAFSAKEHQKDHGQFYTPPGVVDFMWKRTLQGNENLLDKLRAYLSASPGEKAAPKWYQEQSSNKANSPPTLSLIPSVLDPCLGVSTFLSHYLRELVWQTQQDTVIWNSEQALSLLMEQICNHAWGLELDGFVYWIARCGVLAALIPLVQRIQLTLPPPPPLLSSRSMTETEDDHAWELQCIRQLRDPSLLQVSYIVTNPPYMIRKTGTFSMPDPEVYDMAVLGCGPAYRGRASSRASVTSVSTPRSKRGSAHSSRDEGQLFSVHGHEEQQQQQQQQQQQCSFPSTPEPTVVVDDDDPEIALSTNPRTHPGVRRLSRQHSISRGVSSSPSRSRPSTPQQQQYPAAYSSQQSTPTSTVTTGSMSGKASFRGMMQIYGYFIWFATQRIIPQSGVVCMITASQWLTLEFAVNLRAWLMDHCFMEEFFQFEPYKVFARVQTDSLIFKLRSHGAEGYSCNDSVQNDHAVSEQPHTLFLRHLDGRASLKTTLDDYAAFTDDLLARQRGVPAAEPPVAVAPESQSTAEARKEKIACAFKPYASLKAIIRSPTFSFAPMMPSTPLSDYLLVLTANLGSLCTAGTKRAKSQSSVEPLLWHRGPNTNPVYGLVVRMEYALATFGEAVTQRWFRPALYWNGKNAPDTADNETLSSATTTTTTTTTGASFASTPGSNTSGHSRGGDISGDYVELMNNTGTEPTRALDLSTTPSPSEGGLFGPSPLSSSSSTATCTAARPMPPGLHREGQFWFHRDRQRLSRKEGSPAESYVVPKPESERLYVLCMVDKESVKVLRAEVEDGVEGAEALWQYLSDVRQHFQPGLVNKRAAAAAATAAASNASQGTGTSVRLDEDSIAYCSTSQCGADIPCKIIHPINYGYFSKSQPRQRFFLDTSSTAVTNQCIYLTLNSPSPQHQHQNQHQHPPLIYFVTLLNSSVLQYFLLRHCQYDQQGRMRLFRESMAKIPYQPDTIPERVQYAIQLGEHMVRLKEALYQAVSRLQLGHLGVLEWIRRGGEPSPLVVAGLRDHLRTRQVQGLLMRADKAIMSSEHHRDPVRFTRAMSLDMDVDHHPQHQHQHHLHGQGAGIEGEQVERTAMTMTSIMNNDDEPERVIAVLMRAISTVDLLQWAVDQYGYMLYGVGAQYQQLLEEELKIVYNPYWIRVQGNSNSNGRASHGLTINNASGSKEELLKDGAPVQPSGMTMTDYDPPFHDNHYQDQQQQEQQQLRSELYRWDAEHPQAKSVIPAYATLLLKQASLMTRELSFV
ncbi:hypothetical protein BGW42_004141 [Actinomortierella wolfii]|nr:hypothetical protein BGW42_004141 [Actinomortierella wolfii]